MLAVAPPWCHSPPLCFTVRMTWDATALEHLEGAVVAMRRLGMVDVLHEATVRSWAANCARFDPEHLYDDARTLGFTASSNLANRVYDEVGVRRLLPGVTAHQDYTAVVVTWEGWRLRLVKAPAARARQPRFAADFNWHTRETRLAAAQRNAAAYRPPSRELGSDPLFELPMPDAAGQVKGCRDLFLLWGGEITTQLTAGWVGLPTTDVNRWLAVAPLWWDRPQSGSGVTIPRPDDAPVVSFGDEAPVPTIRLKPRTAEAGQ